MAKGKLVCMMGLSPAWGDVEPTSGPVGVVGGAER